MLSPDILVSGLNVLTFQGITSTGKEILVTTLDGDILKITLDGEVRIWSNVAKYGTPAGIDYLGGTVLVCLSAWESGHFFLEIDRSGKVINVTEISALVGEFGSPFGIASRYGYYTRYFIAVSTDVVRSSGSIVRINNRGKINILAPLPYSPFDLIYDNDRLVVTQEDGYLRSIDFYGRVTDIIGIDTLNLGYPLNIVDDVNNWWVTTSKGFLLKIEAEKVNNITDIIGFKYGSPTSLAILNEKLIVMTDRGNLLRILPEMIA